MIGRAIAISTGNGGDAPAGSQGAALFGLTLALLLAACGDSGTAPATPIDGLPRELARTEVELIDASNRFGFELLERMADERPGENLFLSPLSAHLALGMTLNGTAGETLDQMRATLGFGSLPTEEVNAAYRSLLELLLGLDEHVRLRIASSIWVREGFPVQPSFTAVAEDVFEAPARELDFSAPGAPATINQWVSDATGGRIEKMFESIDPLTMLILLNAIHFEGDWSVRFDRDETRTEPFHRADGTTVDVPLMEVADTFRYGATDAWEAVDLPYGGGAFSMTVVLPRQGSPEALLDELDADAWAGLVEGLGSGEGTVRLPRFGMEDDRVLNDVLKAMGMTDAFDPDLADLSRMAEGAGKGSGLHVQRVRQKTFIEVDEEGTEAAAVTSVEVGVVCACGPVPFTFRADRPFLFAIRERFSGTVLFAGIVHDPSRS